MQNLMRKILGMFILISSVIYPCTGIMIKTEDNNIIQARTIEYGESNLNSKIVISPRGKEFRSLTPEGKLEGLKWKAKYGYVGATVITDIFVGEGINEMGLNAGLFYFPHYGSLEKFNPKYKKKSIVDMQLVSWILSNFATVEEVKNGLKKIKIVNIGYEKDGTPLPTAHWRIADATGNSIVLEVINNGEIKIYDNKIGVLTNSPDYDWQVKNLNNYINLYSGNAKSYTLNDQEIFSFGAGTGALGLPGDITPPSRFIRAFYYLTTMKPAQTNEEGVLSAFHILNNFDIPIGVEYSKEQVNYIPQDLLTATQWTAASSLVKKEFYYRSMYSGQIKKIDLKTIDFNNVKYQSFPMDKGQNEIEEVKVK